MTNRIEHPSMDMFIWADNHVTYSFNSCIVTMFESMKAGVKVLQKSNFTNWLINKTSGKSFTEQNKLKKSIAELFKKFDDDNSRVIDFEEFESNFWWIEIFFEG